MILSPKYEIFCLNIGLSRELPFGATASVHVTRTSVQKLREQGWGEARGNVAASE